MKTKIAILLILQAFVATHHAQAGVVGISPTAVTSTAAANQTTLSFTTTSIGGGTKITGVGVWTKAGITGTNNTSIEFLVGGSRVSLGSFNYDQTDVGGERIINWSSDYNGFLNASTTYTVKISNQANFYQIGSNSYNIESTITDYWRNALKGSDTSVAIKLYYDPATVPEPGTLILTGSALVAGAVGAYIKRRRNNRAQADAHS